MRKYLFALWYVFMYRKNEYTTDIKYNRKTTGLELF